MSLRSPSHRISGAKLEQPSGDLWIVKPAHAGWFLPVIGGLVFAFLGAVLFLGGGNFLLLSCFFFGFSIYFMTTYPLGVEAHFDFAAREVNFTGTYLLRRPRHVDWRVPFAHIAGLGLRPRSFGERHSAQLQLQDGAELIMEFGRRASEAEQLIQRYASSAGIAGLSRSDAGATMSLAEATASQVKLQRETRSWGSWLIVMGVLQMISANGISPWGIVLLLLGAASFYFQEAAMLVIYAVTIGWAGLMNLLNSTTIFWRGFAVFQFILVVAILRQFRQFRRAEELAASAATDSTLPPTSTRTQRWFPLIALVLGGAALLLFVAAIGSAFILHNADLLPLINLLETLAVNMAVLGVATGLAGWLTIPANKWVSIAGGLAGGLTLLAELSLPVIVDALL